MAKVEMQAGEQLLKQGQVSYLKSRFNAVIGDGYLTDRRFLHTNNMRGLAVGGLAGALLKGKVDIEVALHSITRVSRGKHGRGSVLEIETAAGEVYRLMVEFDEWLQAFGHALAAHHRTRLVEHAPGLWVAQRG